MGKLAYIFYAALRKYGLDSNLGYTSSPPTSSFRCRDDSFPGTRFFSTTIDDPYCVVQFQHHPRNGRRWNGKLIALIDRISAISAILQDFSCDVPLCQRCTENCNIRFISKREQTHTYSFQLQHYSLKKLNKLLTEKDKKV